MSNAEKNFRLFEFYASRYEAEASKPDGGKAAQIAMRRCDIAYSMHLLRIGGKWFKTGLHLFVNACNLRR